MKVQKRPGTKSMGKVPKKACTENIGMYHAQYQGLLYVQERQEMEKSDFHDAKKSRMKPNPTKLSFAQLSKKMDELKKAIKKLDAKWK
jgi:hypothetical protein